MPLTLLSLTTGHAFSKLYGGRGYMSFTVPPKLNDKIISALISFS